MITAHFGGALAENTSPGRVESDEIRFQALKQKIHEEIVSSLDLAAADGLEPAQLHSQLQPFIDDHLSTSSLKLGRREQSRLQDELQEEMFGIGPLESLMKDPTVSDILVNHPHEVFIERHGKLERTEVVFADNAHLIRIIQRIASFVGRRIDEVSPMVDARLPDGSRVNAVIPPLALDGPKLSIRRFGKVHFQLDRLIENGTLSRQMVDFLSAAVAARKSILISGGTGSGKTTLLNALSARIPADERIVTIEDSAELMLQHPHVARLETRPANSEGAGEYTQRDLLRNSLRMRPDRIIVGEVRGPEALDMLQAMNTGHEGSLTTIHANDTADAISRLEMMVAMTGLELPIEVVRSYIAAGIDIVVHLARIKGGVRRVMRVAEIQRDRDTYLLNDIFFFRRAGVDGQGQAVGQFQIASYIPKCIKQFSELGIEFDSSIFSRNSLAPGGRD